jgi:hypothetical protein
MVLVFVPGLSESGDFGWEEGETGLDMKEASPHNEREIPVAW